GIDQPLYRLSDDPPVHQDAVHYSVSIAAEYVCPYHECVTRNGWCVEQQCQKRPNSRLEVIDKPCQDEAAQVTERPGDCSIDQCVLDCNQEHVVLEEQPQVVVYADKPGRLEHVEVGKAESYRHDD